jgi:hypothetical protein
LKISKSLLSFGPGVFFGSGTLGEIIPGNQAALKVEIPGNLAAGHFALWDRTYLYDLTKSPAEAILDSAAEGILRGWKRIQPDSL